jgi:uncharacterized membrane protein
LPFTVLGAFSRSGRTFRPTVRRVVVIILGLVLLLLGFLLKISILWTIGIILIVVGAVLFLLGSTGRAVGGRRHYY